MLKVAGSIGCPEDFVAHSVLIAAGGAIGQSVSLRLRPNHFASASLYGMNVGGPSSGKSPALDFVMRPFWRINRCLVNAYREAKEKYDQAVEGRKSAAGDKKTPVPVKPVLGSVVIDDITSEAIARLLADNPRGLLMAKDEGIALIRGFNQYKAGGKGNDRQFFLSALMGKPVRVDRKGQSDGLPILIDHPFLGIIGNIPPDLLSEFREKREAHDGFVERFLWAFPDPRPRPRWSKTGVADKTLEPWAKVIEQLRAVKMPMKGGEPCPLVVSFTSEAECLWATWYDAHTEEVNSPGFNDEAIAGEIKLVDFTGRFIVILHLLTLVCDPGVRIGETLPLVPPSALHGAIRLWEYFRSHQCRVRWHLSGGVGNRPAARIIRWLERNRIESFTLKELNDHIRSAPGENENALAWMEGRGIVRPLAEAPRPRGKRGKTPSPGYEVNPALHDCGSRYSQYSPFEARLLSSEVAQQDLRENREVDSCGWTALPESDAEPDCPDDWFVDGDSWTWEY